MTGVVEATNCVPKPKKVVTEYEVGKKQREAKQCYVPWVASAVLAL